MKINKLLNAFLIFLILFIFIGTVSASEIVQSDNDALSSIDDADLEINSKNLDAQDYLAVDDSASASVEESSADDYSGSCDDVLAADNSGTDLEELIDDDSKSRLGEDETLSFLQLHYDLQSTTDAEPLNLSNNYKFNEETDNLLKNGIYIGNYKTINAKGHTFDGSNLARIFNIVGTGRLILNDAIIINGFNNESGGAIFSNYKLVLNNCTFRNNHVINEDGYSHDGGAVYMNPTSAASSIIINNCTFEDNSATGSGGAISVAYFKMISSDQLQIINSTFNNNVADYEYGHGGAIYSYGVTVNGTNFTNNKAGNKTGSGGAIAAPQVVSINSKFINNTAKDGAALSNFVSTDIITDYQIINSTFENNTADLAGGAIKLGSIQLGQMLSIENSSFTNNSAGRYGGGAIIAANTVVKNSNFTDNTAFLYGGAISSQNLVVDNCKFENNGAKHSGAIFAVGFSVKDSQFINNEADDGSIITTRSDFESEGTDLPQVYVFEESYNSIYSTTWWGLDGSLHCIERELEGDNVESFYTDDSSYLINYVDHSPIIEHVKILYYLCNLDENLLEGNFRTVRGQDKLGDAILRLAQEDLSNPQADIVKMVMDLYNSGFRVPDNSYYLPNGTLVKYEFNFFINPQYVQNYLRYNQSLEVPRETVTKETLNKTVKVGDEVQFRITVTNTGDLTLKDVFVIDSDFDDGLVYQSYMNETGKWAFNETTKVWKLTTDLEVYMSASFIVIFKTTKTGELVNNVTAGYANFTMANSTNTTNVTDITKTDNNTNTTNDTNASNSTNETEIPQVDVPDEDEDTPEVDVPDEDEDTPEEEEDSPEEITPKEDTPVYEKSINKKVALSKSVAGNPLFALLLMIVTLVFVPKRK